MTVLGEESEGVDARQAGERFDPDDLRRLERPLESLEARREIRDPQVVAMSTDRLDNRRIAHSYSEQRN
jgi:hypothetical protein